MYNDTAVQCLSTYSGVCLTGTHDEIGHGEDEEVDIFLFLIPILLGGVPPILRQ